jgi:hypothetical protein
MIVTHHLPTPRQGLAGRPPVVVPDSPGLFVAGDWVGSDGWLADCSLISGERAGLWAARQRSDSARAHHQMLAIEDR